MNFFFSRTPALATKKKNFKNIEKKLQPRFFFVISLFENQMKKTRKKNISF